MTLLAPEDRSLRFDAAQSYLEDNNLQMARVMVLPLAFDPHDAGLAAAATKSLAEIDRRIAGATAKPKEAAPKPTP